MGTRQLFATSQKSFPNSAFPLISHLSPGFSSTIKVIIFQTGEHCILAAGISRSPSPVCRSPRALSHLCPQEVPSQRAGCPQDIAAPLFASLCLRKELHDKVCFGRQALPGAGPRFMRMSVVGLRVLLSAPAALFPSASIMWAACLGDAKGQRICSHGGAERQN